MDEQTNGHEQPPTTSLLELLYLIRAKNRGELTFAEWRASALGWAQAVLAEYEAGEADARTVNEDECG
ncbi:MAG TPA: hypothetical protein VF026_03565 [Ktedonobacteraceae bacterium]